MKVLIVFAHDKPASLVHALATTVFDTARESQVEVDYLDLYQWAPQIPFYYHDRTLIEANPFFKQTREQIMTADRLVLVFPVYWYSTPGIMKCWIDLITNYAWKYEGRLYARPLHHIKRLLTITTTMSPNWYNFIIRYPAQKQIYRTFRWMGVKEFISHDIGNAAMLQLEDFDAIAHKVATLTKKLIQ